MSVPVAGLSPAELQRAARDHLWLHFTRMSSYRDGEVPVIVRGDGCYLEDSNGNRYLDALAGLFAVNIGYGFGEEMGEAAAAQMRELPFYTNWSYAHPRAIELAAEVASLAPGRPEPCLLRLRRLRGGRVGLEAGAPVPRCARRAAGGRRSSRRGRLPRDDDGRALDQRHRLAPHARSSRSSPTSSTSATRTATTGRPRRPRRSSPPSCSRTSSRRSSRRAGDRRDGDHGARPERGRLLHAAGGLLVQGVREICDRYGSCSARTR